MIVVREPVGASRLPVLVTVPHYGIEPMAGFGADAFADPRFVSFAYGYADAFARAAYAELNRRGVTVIASRLSRLFVDLNRRRDDLDVDPDGSVRSTRGVVRTHTVRGGPIFARPIPARRAEAWLQRYYDPFYREVSTRLDALRERWSSVVLLDAHTGSPRRMGERQVILGTRRGTTALPRWRDRAGEVFACHRYAVETEVSGYAGGNVVRAFGAPASGVQAIQVEVNAGLLHPGSREAYIDAVRAGERPRPDPGSLDRLRGCMSALVETLGADLAG